MRIPYEGMLAALALRQVTEPAPPLLVSVWGNDFTLHARANPWMASLTRQALRAAQALHTDCQRDQRLAAAWGFDPARPTVVLPGAGGIQSALFYPPAEGAPSGAPLVVNPRGFRAYVRSDTFFKAIPLVLQQHPQTRFACPTMAGEAQAERWLDRLAVRPAVELLPRLPRSQMAQLFRRAQVVVSPATHDGTPNTLLEAMACGCFPIAGNLESLREWITPGENGLLFNPADPAALAGAILRALQEPELRKKAACSNLRLIAERAAYEVVMPKAEAFYSSMTKSPSR
jgi:glycosyltransferase involved in cell wall biosynthesis